MRINSEHRGLPETLAPGEPRPAETEDVDAISHLSAPFVHSGALRYRDEVSLRAQLSDFVVMVHDQTLIGCVGLRQLPATSPGLVIYNFCVHPRFHGHGVGTALLKEAVRLAEQRGVHEIFAASNQSGSWFTRHGFTVIDFDQSPQAWRGDLDPRRKSTLFMRAVSGTG